MDIKLLTIFITLNIFNVIIQTIKNIVTIKCGKVIASVVNAIAFGLYTIVTVYMLCDLPLLWKASIVALCNLVGVYVVKLIEEKSRKDKMWKVEATVPNTNEHMVSKELTFNKISYNFIKINKDWTVFNIYCANKEQSAKVKAILEAHNAKYFVSETKIL
jgi:uncharacterized protein YebE (UPF0316 family)